MKRIFLFFLLFTANVKAADFSPTPMTISVQPQLGYKFDGSHLEIPFTLTGKSGAIWLVINTHGQADNIVNVKNGYLGWHFVNKIDTTIYISNRFERQPGENTITWDGRDENGNKAEAGSYDYYLWGYDNKSSDELVCDYLRVGYEFYAQQAQIYDKDNQGLPLSNPVIMGNFWRGDYSHFKDDLYKQGTQF